MRKTLIALFAALISPSAASAECEVGKILELKITMQGARPLADIGINGRSIPFIVDSGAFFSTISPGTAAELGLRLEPSPIQLRGIGGQAGSTNLAHVKSLDLAGIPLHDILFIVGGSETGVGGLLGQNVLGIGDVEYDLGHGFVRVMRASGCSLKNNLAYWSGDAPVSALPVDMRSPSHPHTIGTILVNGVKVRAIFDTGAGSSILSLSAARRVGLTPSTSGVVRLGLARGLGRSMVETWLAPVASVTIGAEDVRNIKLRIGELGIEDADMLVGADFFLSHRVYVSNSLHRMYFTYDGGPVFSAMPRRVVDEAGRPQTVGSDSNSEPADADGFSRRGAAEMSRRDYKAALADLERAVTMDPANGVYLLQRARAHLLLGERAEAFANLDRAVNVAQSDPQVRLARAESLVRRGRKAEAMIDLDVAESVLPKQADERLTIASLFGQADQFEKAIKNYDLWIAAHPDDSRQPVALNGRCWVRALAGRELPLAMKDCDAALRRSKSSSYFDSRGLVELRMGQYDRAIADYNEALQLRPGSAWSLYGRGLARRHKNDPSSQSDLDAAVAIDPTLPSRLRALGIS